MLLLRPALRQRPLLRLRPARSWGRLQRQYRQGPLKEPMRLLAKGPLRLLLLRKRSPKGWLLRNAPHQRGRPTQRKSPARLLKRNEYKRATSWPVCYRPLADISLTSTNVRFRTRFMYFPRIRQIGSSFGVRVPPIAKSRRERKPMTAMGHKQCNRHVCFIPERGHSDRQVLCRGTTSLTTRLMADDPLHQQLRRDTTGPRRRIPGYRLPVSCGVLRRGLTLAFLQMMSALPPEADICGAARDVRFGFISGRSYFSPRYTSQRVHFIR